MTHQLLLYLHTHPVPNTLIAVTFISN